MIAAAIIDVLHCYYYPIDDGYILLIGRAREKIKAATIVELEKSDDFGFCVRCLQVEYFLSLST